MDLQYANIMFYPVDMSRFISTLSAKPDPGRQDLRPPAMHPDAFGSPGHADHGGQTYGIGGGGRAEFIPLMVELFKDVKAIFKDNPVEAFTKGTGGTEYSFYSQRAWKMPFRRSARNCTRNILSATRPITRTRAGSTRWK